MQHSIVSIILIVFFFLFLSANSVGQRIGVVEYNRLSGRGKRRVDDISENKYHYYIRDLFEKNKEGWTAVENNSFDSTVIIKKMTQYFYPEGTEYRLVKGYRNKQDLKDYLSNELYRLKKTSSLQLVTLPDYILKGFEYNDILSCKIVAGNKYPAIMIANFREKRIDSLQAAIIKDSLRISLRNCDQLALAEEGIRFFESGLMLNDSVFLGKVVLPHYVTCFNPSSSAYGGGILHYIGYPGNKVIFLHSNTFLLDVRDYDNDGKYEYVFFSSWFNNYHYILYYDDFTKYVVKGWSYH